MSHNCAELIEMRERCWAFHGGKDTEECLVEELREKRCLSFSFCPKAAKAFYGSPAGQKATCALWAEAFAFTESANISDFDAKLHASTHEQVNNSPKTRSKCREVTMALSKCLANNSGSIQHYKPSS